MISIDALREKYDYDPGTGAFRNRRLDLLITNRKKNRNTYYQHVEVCGRVVYAHRAAWAMHYGEWPKGQIDHRDGDGMNNRIDNLRDATHSENQRNQRVHKKSKTGVRGVSFHTPSGKWQASIWIGGGVRLFLGRFTTIELAAAARREAERVHWGR